MEPFLVDFKEYQRSYTVSVDSWAKICSDAVKAGNRIPALKLILTDGDKKVRVWVVPEHVIHDYVERYNEGEENG